MNDDLEPDIPDFVQAIAYALKGDGIGYLEAKSMVEQMFAECWDSVTPIADLDCPSEALH